MTFSKVIDIISIYYTQIKFGDWHTALVSQWKYHLHWLSQSNMNFHTNLSIFSCISKFNLIHLIFFKTFSFQALVHHTTHPSPKNFRHILSSSQIFFLILFQFLDFFFSFLSCIKLFLLQLRSFTINLIFISSKYFFAKTYFSKFHSSKKILWFLQFPSSHFNPPRSRNESRVSFSMRIFISNLFCSFFVRSH